VSADREKKEKIVVSFSIKKGLKKVVRPAVQSRTAGRQADHSQNKQQSEGTDRMVGILAFFLRVLGRGIIIMNYEL
jgi:hypothetical protein